MKKQRVEPVASGPERDRDISNILDAANAQLTRAVEMVGSIDYRLNGSASAAGLPSTADEGFVPLMARADRILNQAETLASKLDAILGQV